MNIEELKFPIGKCNYKEEYTEQDLQQYVLEIETFPKRIELIVQHYSEQQLKTPYRPNGWTVNQVIHHCADSHINMLIRLKLALTENNPTIKPYQEDLWAEMVDYNLPFNNSITLLYCVHAKITAILKSLKNDDFNKTYYHNQYQKTFRVSDVMCLYAWHGNHHIAHIKLVK